MENVVDETLTFKVSLSIEIEGWTLHPETACKLSQLNDYRLSDHAILM
jgi:hypothetical protein